MLQKHTKKTHENAPQFYYLKNKKKGLTGFA
jgi:hypothetical protein